MPRSKHRKKPGGKAVYHPGQGRTGLRSFHTSRETAYRRVRAGIWKALNTHYQGEEFDAIGHLVDCITDAAFERSDQVAEPVTKQAVLDAFTAPILETSYTIEMADAALAKLVERGIVVLKGEHILLASSFPDEEMPTLHQLDLRPTDCEPGIAGGTADGELVLRSAINPATDRHRRQR